MDLMTQINRLSDRPLLMHPDFAMQMFSTLKKLDLSTESLQEKALGFFFSDNCANDEKENNRIAVIRVSGVLTYRGWYCSYLSIESQIQAALDNESIEEIVLDCSSGGGEAAGAFELAEFIYKSRSAKPITAILSNLALSACYLIASACTEVVIPPTGEAGSIGVLYSHRDWSEYYSDMGLKTTFVFAGAHKVDGNPYEKLPKEVQARMQSEVNELYGMFTSAVSRYRDISEQQVIDTQALVYMGQSAVDIGLCDRIETRTQAFERLAQESEQSTFISGDNDMTKKADNAEVEEPNKEAAADQNEGQPQAQAAEQSANATEASQSTDNSQLYADIMDKCTAAGVPELASGFIRNSASLAQVEARLEEVSTIKDLCVAANTPEASAGYVMSGLSVDAVRAKLFDHLVAQQGQEVDNSQSPEQLMGTQPKAAEGWANAIKKTGGKLK